MGNCVPQRDKEDSGMVELQKKDQILAEIDDLDKADIMAY